MLLVLGSRNQEGRAASRRLLALGRRISKYSAPVLLTGESSTGKSIQSCPATGYTSILVITGIFIVLAPFAELAGGRCPLSGPFSLA